MHPNSDNEAMRCTSVDVGFLLFQLLVREQKKLGASVIKIRDSEPASIIRNAIIQEARNQDLLVVEHQTDINKSLAILKDNRILNPDIFTHSVPDTFIGYRDRDAMFSKLPRRMKANNIGIITTLQATKWKDREKNALDLLSSCKEKGVIFGRGTDSGYKGKHGNRLYYEYDRLADHFKKWSVALKAATLDAARLLKKEKEIGSIRLGALADFLVLDTLPYNSSVISDYHMLVKSGEVIKKK